MASVTRLSNAAFRASLRSPAMKGSAFNAVRCYSAKTQVRRYPLETALYFGYKLIRAL